MKIGRLVMTVLILTGCGRTAQQSSFQPISNDEVKTAFLETPTTTTTTTTVASRPAVPTAPTTIATTTTPPSTIATEEVSLFFIVADGSLHRVRTRRATPVVPTDVLRDLLRPTDSALKTLVTADLVQSLTLGKVVAVAVNPTFSARPLTEQLLIAAQITLTLTDLRGISSVQFTIDGEVIDVPSDVGVTSPVGQADFASHVGK